MKWINPGHQLDEIGEKLVKVKDLYIWGVDDSAQRAIKLIEWLGVVKDFNISFVIKDASRFKKLLKAGKNIAVGNKERLDTIINGRLMQYPVLSESEMYVSVCKNINGSAIILSSRTQTTEAATIKNKGIVNLFYLDNSTFHRDNYVQNFLSVWLMYKHQKLLSHAANFLVTEKCNLNCDGCLNFTKYLSNPKDVPFESYKQHIDAFFSKFDYINYLQLSGGETMLFRDLPRFIDYIADNYRNRVFEFFVTTNSTISPSKDVLEAVKRIDGYFMMDDYSENVSITKTKKIQAVLKKVGVGFTNNKPEYWCDLDVFNTDNSHFTEEQLEEYKDNCNSYFNEFAEGKMFACNFQIYAERAGIIEHDPYNNCVDILDTSPMELLEFAQGYTHKGYMDLCKHCRGIGTNAKQIKPAVQVLKAGKAKQIPIN